MKSLSVAPATLAQPTPQEIALSGYWTALGVATLDQQLAALKLPATKTEIVVDGAGVESLDTVGVWILQKWLQRLRDEGHSLQMRGFDSRFSKLLELGAQPHPAPPPAVPRPSTLERVGRDALAAGEQARALLSFIGESAVALWGSVRHPARMRWRPILYNIRTAGFDALPIIGLLSFLLGLVIAYQAADQLKKYGANIFVADLVGLSMLREFAPLMTAIIVAGRSGSAFAAQIGTMAVTEEIDSMRTIGIVPMDLLVLPKILALIVALPLLTFFADVLGVFGGMIMARAHLGVGFEDFLDRFTKAVSVTTYVIGIGKAPVFAAIIAMVGCFQGFRTSGGADSVGRQTTLSVVQSIFLVIVADALFSIIFSLLDL
jgi:phospholipid/cholesterol/gamma-HCH transport system permease protein